MRHILTVTIPHVETSKDQIKMQFIRLVLFITVCFAITCESSPDSSSDANNDTQVVSEQIASTLSQAARWNNDLISYAMPAHKEFNKLDPYVAQIAVKCIGDIRCFNAIVPREFDILPNFTIDVLPGTPAQLDLRFFHIKPDDFQYTMFPYYVTVEDLKENLTFFDPSQGTKFIIHGWMANFEGSTWMRVGSCMHEISLIDIMFYRN